jgi:hypothetical protein
MVGLSVVGASREANDSVAVHKPRFEGSGTDYGLPNRVSHSARWEGVEQSAHPATETSKGKVRVFAETTGGMCSFLSFTIRTIAVSNSSRDAWSFIFLC